ncbi:hypothetical protein AGMMS4956_15780 [Bacteroidia bacterium]|nr:hypothetical protein AGMMS4956_15780 [Bacteroidia bacterium]
MSAVKAYYDGVAFVPMIPLDIQKGRVFMLSVLQDYPPTQDVVKKIMAFKHITNNLRRIEHLDPLSSEFDKIVSQRVNFKREVVL